MIRYNCDLCGCYLDPGEGLLCDECRQKVRERHSEVGEHRGLYKKAMETR